MNKDKLNNINIDAIDTPESILLWAVSNYDANQIAFASSLGAEDQVLTDILSKISPQINIFTIDTGKLSPESYDLIEKTEKKYGFKYEILKPDERAVAEIVKEHGEELYYKNLELRKLCCDVRKIQPLKIKLKTLKIWICGLRTEQSITRKDVKKIEWDESFNILKLNPLSDWTDEQVWEYIKANNVPYHALHDRGYTSIGCAPCTRAIEFGEDIRAGRWWWENPIHKECGLHKRRK